MLNILKDQHDYSLLVKAGLDIVENYECPESFEGGKCNMKEILGCDCDDNDNHCVAKEVLTNIIYRMYK